MPTKVLCMGLCWISLMEMIMVWLPKSSSEYFTPIWCLLTNGVTFMCRCLWSNNAPICTVLWHTPFIIHELLCQTSVRFYRFARCRLDDEHSFNDGGRESHEVTLDFFTVHHTLESSTLSMTGSYSSRSGFIQFGPSPLAARSEE